MALATRCPHCQTTFRVVPDQLKLRAGLVRCGACKQIFNGLEQLLPPEDGAAPAAPPPASATPAAPASQTETPVEPQEPASPSAASLSDDFRQPGEANNDPLLRMTLMDFSEFERAKEARAAASEAAAEGEPDESALSHAEEEESAELNQDIEHLQQTLRSDPKRAASLRKMEDVPQEPPPEVPEPGFVQQARRQARIGRSRQIAMRTAAVVLSISLLGQAAYAFRDQLAAWMPQSAPLLAQGCALLGCAVGLPAQIDAVSIESSELQALASSQDTFVLVTLLRNRSATPQTWPHIELTLNDPSERAIVRRVIGPREYLPSPQEIAKGLAANSEQPVKVFFELAQLKASGYRVYLFYP
jgi:predicted Zn finger-like uncharacterized protein